MRVIDLITLLIALLVLYAPLELSRFIVLFWHTDIFNYTFELVVMWVFYIVAMVIVFKLVRRAYRVAIP